MKQSVLWIDELALPLAVAEVSWPSTAGVHNDVQWSAKQSRLHRWACKGGRISNLLNNEGSDLNLNYYIQLGNYKDLICPQPQTQGQNEIRWRYAYPSLIMMRAIVSHLLSGPLMSVQSERVTIHTHLNLGKLVCHFRHLQILDIITIGKLQKISGYSCWPCSLRRHDDAHNNSK